LEDMLVGKQNIKASPAIPSATRNNTENQKSNCTEKLANIIVSELSSVIDQATVTFIEREKSHWHKYQNIQNGKQNSEPSKSHSDLSNRIYKVDYTYHQVEDKS